LCISGIGAGCAVNEKDEVAAYRKILDGGDAQSIKYSPDAPLDLLTAMRLTNLHNERLAVEGENYLQALIDKQRAASRFMPTITLAPEYRVEGDGDVGRTGNGGTTDPDDDDDDDGNGFTSSGGANGQESFEFAANGRYNAFNGYRDIANYRRAGRTIEQRRAILRDAQQRVLLDVARVYYEVIRAEELVKVLENTAKLQDERVRNAQARQRAGFGRPLDVAQQAAQAAQTRVTLIGARDDVWNGRTTLAFLAHANIADCPLVDEYDVPKEVPGAGAWVEQAYASRPDLAAARAATRAAAEGVREAVGQYYPSVTLDLNYYFVRTGSRSDEGDWDSVLSANLPLFAGGAIHANVRTALSQLRQARSNEAGTRRQVEQDILLARRALATSDSRLAQLTIQWEAASESLRRSRLEYDAGTATNLDVLTAQDALLSAELQTTSEKFTRKLDYLNLLRASGRLGENLRGGDAVAVK
jgi:protease secretion system outer membrane protein